MSESTFRISADFTQKEIDNTYIVLMGAINTLSMSIPKELFTEIISPVKNLAQQCERHASKKTITEGIALLEAQKHIASQSTELKQVNEKVGNEINELAHELLLHGENANDILNKKS